MVQLTENEGPNQQRGNKRSFSNAGDNNQGGRNPRGDQGGKFQRQSFGDRGPFNKGGDRPFNNGNRFNRGGPFNKDNNFNRGRNQNFGQGRDNQNFNRGRNNQNFQGRNNQNFRKGGFQNNRFNKSWEGNGADNAPDFEQSDSVTKHKKFHEEIEIEQGANIVDTQPKHKKSKNVEQNEDETSSSDSDQEVKISLQKNQKTKEDEEEETSSESEEDSETNANLQKNQNVSKNEDVDDETSSESEEEIETVSKTVQKVQKNEEEETSSSEDEEIVTNSNNVQNNQSKDEEDKESKDKIEANDSEEQQREITTDEDNTSTEKQNGKTKNNSVVSRIIFVRSLPALATKQQIQKFFERYGKIECIKFKTDSSACAEIIFEKEEDAEKAKEVSGMMYKNHRISVFIRTDQYTKYIDMNMSIFAREIPNDITIEDLWDAFESTYGPVRDIALPTKRPNSHKRHRGYAIIDFHFVDSKKLAVADKQITIKGNIIKVTPNIEREKSDRTPGVYNGRIQKFEPRRFLGGPRFSNAPRRFSGGPRNYYEPRAGPGNIQVRNTPGNAITITLGSNSFQGRPKFNPRNTFKGRRQ